MLAIAQNRPYGRKQPHRAMTDAELAAVCWVRAVEQGAPGDGQGVPWSDDDAASASRQARRAVGEAGDRAKAQAFVVKRALWAQQRLADATRRGVRR